MKKKKYDFMKIIIIVCLLFVMLVIEQGLIICFKINDSPIGIVTATITFFGAELILCMFKRIFEKEDRIEEYKRNKKIKKELEKEEQ